MLIFVALLTLTTGNLAAITQTNTKRLLAYSSIAHVGYMMLGLVASDGVSNRTGIKGILFYLLVYTFMNIGAFAVLTSLRRRKIVGDTIEDIAGLLPRRPRRKPLLMLVFLLSLAGIPPLAGFYGKYFIFLSLIETGHFALATVAVLYAVVALYYYLKIANAMFMGKAISEEPVPSTPAMNVALVFYRCGHGHHRTLPQRLHPGRELVRLQPWRGRNCTVEVAPAFSVVQSTAPSASSAAQAGARGHATPALILLVSSRSRTFCRRSCAATGILCLRVVDSTVKLHASRFLPCFRPAGAPSAHRPRPCHRCSFPPLPITFSPRSRLHCYMRRTGERGSDRGERLVAVYRGCERPSV